jgi:hypothetical protein
VCPHVHPQVTSPAAFVVTVLKAAEVWLLAGVDATVSDHSTDVTASMVTSSKAADVRFLAGVGPNVRL